MAIHILGIRHHGVGSARQVQKYLAEHKPDIILVEGAPEMTDMLSFIGHKELCPPVALMIYNTDDPHESTFYPFSEFSPEWVAVKYANENNIPVKAIDSLIMQTFLLNREEKEEGKVTNPFVYHDPLDKLAEIAGSGSGENFWEDFFEYNDQDAGEHFESTLLTMQTLREDDEKSSSDYEENMRREAYMRQYIRETQNALYENIVVVCGAWHAPVLTDISTTGKGDSKLIKTSRKKIKIASTWIPWTNGRLSMASGYGAGINSPGWYQHLWSTKENTEISWLTNVASAFREAGIDISTAHVIEAYRLALGLSNIRNKSHVGLNELNEAVLSVMCMGDAIMLELIKEKLIIGSKLGSVPVDIPKVPLQEDFESSLKSLRLKLSEGYTDYTLDLRKDIDLKKSIFFHRLNILGISFANQGSVNSKGTFKEAWKSRWKPEMMISLIDKAYLGNTIESASATYIIGKTKEATLISEVAELIQLSIPSELFSCIDFLLDKINQLSAISSDIVDLMKALPPLIDVSRYGNVRNSDLSVLNTIVQQLLIKVFIGLPNGCYGLNEDNSNEMFERISQLHLSIRIYDQKELQDDWHTCLTKITEHDGIHPIIEGCVCRLLFDAGIFTPEYSYNLVSRSLSTANNAQDVAAWIEGFLRGNASVLIYDNKIWNLLYSWVAGLESNAFQELLPMLRRAFSKFEYGERFNIGKKAQQGLMDADADISNNNDTIDLNRAMKVIPVLKTLMNV